MSQCYSVSLMRMHMHGHESAETKMCSEITPATPCISHIASIIAHFITLILFCNNYNDNTETYNVKTYNKQATRKKSSTRKTS